MDEKTIDYSKLSMKDWTFNQYDHGGSRIYFSGESNQNQRELIVDTFMDKDFAEYINERAREYFEVKLDPYGYTGTLTRLKKFVYGNFGSVTMVIFDWGISFQILTGGSSVTIEIPKTFHGNDDKNNDTIQVRVDGAMKMLTRSVKDIKVYLKSR